MPDVIWDRQIPELSGIADRSAEHSFLSGTKLLCGGNNAPAAHGMRGPSSELQPRKSLQVPVSTDVFCLQVSYEHLKTRPFALDRQVN